MNHYEWLKDHLTAIRNGGFTTKDLMDQSLTSLDEAIQSAVLAEREECAKIAENTRDGYSAAIRLSEDEQEFVKDIDGPWVLNADIAKAIRARSQSAPRETFPTQEDMNAAFALDCHYGVGKIPAQSPATVPAIARPLPLE